MGKLAATAGPQLTGGDGLPAEDSEGQEQHEDPTETPEPGTEPDPGDEPGDEDTDPEGADQLGDPGKKALDRMKAERNAERKRARELQREIEELRQAQEAASKPADERALDEARREAEAKALAKADERILRAEVKSLAAGKLNDPADALRYLDLSEYEVDENGDVDTEEISEAIADLLERKPYLAAQGGSASFDSARGKPKPKRKLTRSDLAGMTAEQIDKAHREGRIQT